MAKDNATFIGKAILDERVEAYSEEVYGKFDYDRTIGKAPQFGCFYYPAMVASCTDLNQSMYCDSFARKPIIKEYCLTKMMDEMMNTFPFVYAVSDELKRLSHHKHPIGQCAEQHAANELLFCIKYRNVPFYNQIQVKKDIYFSKAIRPSTGEEFDYCQNCKDLFDL